jgi:serine/threonine protein kinase
MSDIWSLGVLLYGIVTGDRPWRHSNVNQLVNEIQTVRYTLPDYLSPECGDLIGRMLVAIPAKRLTITQVLAHPWFNRAKDCKVALPTRCPLRPSALPSLHGMSMGEIASASRTTSTLSSHGIHSPFAAAVSEDEHSGSDNSKRKFRAPRSPSLPHLCVTSELCITLQKKKESENTESPSGRTASTMTARGRPISGSLHVPMRVFGQPLSPLPAIGEL